MGWKRIVCAVALLFLVVSLAACSGGKEGFTAGGAIPVGTQTSSGAPFVVSTSPTDNAPSTPVNQTIVVNFNKPLNTSTLNGAVDVTYSSGGPKDVPGLVTVSGSSLVFQPGSSSSPVDLNENTEFRVIVRASFVKDRSDNEMKKDYEFYFRTGAGRDTVSPTLTSAYPVAGAVDIPLGTTISLTFSEKMDRISLGPAVTVTDEATLAVVDCTYDTADLKTFVFTPKIKLSGGRRYRVTLNSLAKDLSGNALSGGQQTWVFTAETKYVLSTDPPDAALNIPVIQHTVTVKFLEDMDVSSIVNNSLTLVTAGGTSVGVSSVSTPDLRTAVFTLSDRLSKGSIYMATLSGGVRSFSQATMGRPHQWVFSASNETDIVAPGIVANGINPSDGATNQGTNPTIGIAFTEPIDGFMISGKIALYQVIGTSETPVALSVSLLNSNTVSAFAPTGLLPNAAYRLRVSKSITDFAGNEMVADISSTFFTNLQVIPDVLPPETLSRSPAPNATNVDVDSVLRVVFNEQLDPRTVATGGSYLGGAIIDGVPGTARLESDGVTVVFTPQDPLRYSTLYRAQYGAVKDLAGNPAVARAWTFTTEPPPDVTPPTIVSTDPTSGQDRVPITASVTVTFSEPMNKLTLSGTNFQLFGPLGLVASTVTPSADGAKAVLKPSASLLNGAHYNLAIAAQAITDPAGNAVGQEALQLDFTTQWTRLDGRDHEDEASAIATDPLGNVYIAISSKSDIAAKYGISGDPSRDLQNTTFDVYILKYPVSGGAEYWGHLGTTRDDYAKTMHIDRDGNVYVAGWSTGADGDLANAYPSTPPKNNTDKDIFVAKFSGPSSTTGTRPVWANRYRIQLPTSGVLDTIAEEARAIVITGKNPAPLANRLFVAGVAEDTSVSSPGKKSVMLELSQMDGSYSNTTNWPKIGVFEDLITAMPFHVRRNVGALDNVHFTFALGDEANAIADDGQGNIYVAGSMLIHHAYDFDGTGNTTMADHDVVVAKYSVLGIAGTALANPRIYGPLWSEYLTLSTPAHDFAVGAHTDINGSLFIIGNTYGVMPTQATFGLNDAFVAKLLPSGVGEPVWIHQFGGAGNDEPISTAINPAGNIYVVGRTSSGSMTGSNQVNQGGHDGFVTMLDNYNGLLVWTRMVGTTGEEKALSARTDFFGNVYVGGFTPGNMLDLTNNGATDAFLIKYDINGNRQ